jgi:hypothetical protein
VNEKRKKLTCGPRDVNDISWASSHKQLLTVVVISVVWCGVVVVVLPHHHFCCQEY